MPDNDDKDKEKSKQPAALQPKPPAGGQVVPENPAASDELPSATPKLIRTKKPKL